MPTARLALAYLAENQSGPAVILNSDLDAIDAGAALLAVANTYTARNDFTESIPAVTTRGIVNIGGGGFSTGVAPNFVGSSAGQALAINTAAGFVGRLAEFQRGGVSVLRVVADGRIGIGISGSLDSQLYITRPAAAASPANATYLRVQAVADTAMTASTEVRDVDFILSRTLQFATGALTNQRAVAISAPTYSFVGASTITNAATFYIADAPVAGTNATITNRYSVWIDAGKARFDGDGTHVFELPADATDPTAGGGAAAGRIPVLIGGALRHLAYY